MTDQTTDKFALTVRREIAAPAEDLFDAWLDAESLSAWMKPGTIRETRVETDPREGGEFRIVMVQEESNEILHTGTYRVIDRPRRLVFTWSSPNTDFRDSIVTVTFESLASSTVVQIHQVGLPSAAAQAGHEDGWSDALRELERIMQ
jgi:uncharacterized protein YndB with AHSA1/START domain